MSVRLWVMWPGCGHADSPLLQELIHNVGHEVGSIITVQDGGGGSVAECLSQSIDYCPCIQSPAQTEGRQPS